MDLSLTGEQASLKNKAATFSRGELRSVWNRLDESNDQLIDTAFTRASEAGLFEACLNQSSYDFITTALIAEELAWGDGSLGLVLANVYLSHRAARLVGNTAIENVVRAALQKSTSCFETVLLWPDQSEAAQHAEDRRVASSEILGNRLRGRHEISMARRGTSLCLGCANLKESDKPERVVFFTANLDKPGAGLSLRPVKTFGLRAISFSNISFELALDDEDLLFRFADRKQYETFSNTLSAERAVLLGATLLGIARAAFEYALDYAGNRTSSGKPISQHQAIALKLADMGIELEASRLMLWEAAASRGEYGVDDELARLAWIHCEEVAHNVSLEAVQVLGGHGYTKDHPVEKWMRDIRFLRVLHGRLASEKRPGDH